jgi:hypothetical protein
VFVSALDVLFTWLILAADGEEVNALADWIIRNHSLPGLAVFKFATVVLVLLICEVGGRRRFQTGAKLARWAVVLSGFPAVVGAAHLLRIALGHAGRWPPRCPDPADRDTGWCAERVMEADILRIVDVNVNRLREALRVIEDYARFALDDGDAAGAVKHCRHELQSMVQALGADGCWRRATSLATWDAT